MEYVKKFALDLLIENNISKFPVDIFSIKSETKKWEFFTYLEGLPLIEMHGCLSLCEEKHAFTVPVSENKYHIFYNEKLSYDELINAISHEFGHIIMAHSSMGLVLGKSVDKKAEDRQELEADAFTKYFLSPACVLAKSNIISAQEISKATALQMPLAMEVVDEAARLIKDVLSPEEAQICKQFKEYITKNKRQNYKKPLNYICAGFAAAIIIILIISAIAKFSPQIQSLSQMATGTNQHMMLDVNANAKVYTTSAGNKFHLKNCISIKDNNTLKEWSVEDAIKEGYGACKICQPLER